MNELPTPTEFSHYRIVSKIGKGGMGEVYEAIDTELDRRVAIKILPEAFVSDQKRLQRFIQEAKSASALNHPNILTIYEIGTIGPSRFIATEFIDGETLRQRMRASPIKLNEVLDIITQIASALVAAHSAGIVHRDIKPENIMLRRDGLAKLLDFGLAKSIERPHPADTSAQTRTGMNTEPGVVMGTILYMSPEQARGLPVDARTDIFSLGAVLFEIVAGKPPFEGSNTNEIVAWILSEAEPPPLARYAREVPAELERIVAKAMRKDRNERYQTVQDLLLDLKSLKQQLDIEKRLGISVTRTGVLQSQAKRSRLPLTALSFLLLLALIGSGYWFIIHHKSSGTPIDSIAVLPFENVTHDQNTEYLSDGVTESLINSLSQLPNIKVIARNSVFTYKNQTPNLKEVARQLDVQAVLTGRVLMRGDILDVNVELTDARNNIQLWGDHYPRKSSDIFTVQDDIARQVTEKLRVRLTGVRQAQVTKRPTENTDAYRLYLQGRYYLNDFSEENLKRALPLFDQAIASDPQYALAYAARAEVLYNLGDLSLPMDEAMTRAKKDALTALKIDDKLAEARTILAVIEFQYDWNFNRADQDFKQAVGLNPNYAEAHHQYAWYLAIIGKEMEAVAEFKLAQHLDPVNPAISIDPCLPFMFARQFDSSIAQARTTIETFPSFFIAHMTLGNSLFFKGDHAAGIEELEKAKVMEPTPHLIGNLGHAYAKAGRTDEARKLLADLEKLSKRRYVSSYWIAMIYVGLDDKDEAFAWLEKAYQQRSFFLLFIKMEPMVDSLRSDPRFADLLRRINFPK